MTVLLTPDKKPFYVGTYFPKRQKFGRPRIMEILQQIADMWRDDRQRILESGDKITEAIKPHFRSFSKGELSEDTLKKGYDRLLARPKELYDGAIPSGNSVMAYNLIRHNRLVGSERFGDYADQQLRAFSAQVNNYPPGYSFFLLALQLALGTSQEIVIAEGENVEEFGDMVSCAAILPPLRRLRDEGQRIARRIHRTRPGPCRQRPGQRQDRPVCLRKLRLPTARHLARRSESPAP